MKNILVSLVVVFFAFQMTCFAAVTITRHTGVIKIIPAGSGAPITIKAGEPIPAIPDGATIELMTGDITVSTTAPSVEDLLVKGNTIVMSTDTTIQMSVNSNGAITIYDAKGKANVKTTDGKTASMVTGNTITIKGLKLVEGYTPPDVNPQGIIINPNPKPDFSTDQ
jgi:hypothetical protein